MRLSNAQAQQIDGVIVENHRVSDLGIHFATHDQTEELYSNWVENTGRPGALQMLGWGSCLPTVWLQPWETDRWK